MKRLLLVLSIACSAPGADLDTEDENLGEQHCGPEQDPDKFGTIPNTNALGLTGSGLAIYPFYPDSKVRAYGISAAENDMAQLGAAMADYWNPHGRVFRVVNAADATVQVTATSPPKLWKGCGDIPVHDCWFASTSCQSSVGATGAPSIRLCKSWRIELNFPSMQLFADTNDIPLDNVSFPTIAHEVGHAMGLRHRSVAGTIMHPGVPLPDWTPGITWNNLPRFDACQVAALGAYYVDENDLSMVSVSTPTECL